MRCVDCRYFVKDVIGDGTGIGRCLIGADEMKTNNYAKIIVMEPPLYPKAKRHCDQFKPINAQWIRNEE